jgi:hypothetical protein
MGFGFGRWTPLAVAIAWQAAWGLLGKVRAIKTIKITPE